MILDIEDDIKEAMRQLNDTNHYKELPNEPTKLHCKLVNSTIENFKRQGVLKGELAGGLKVSEPRTSLFYLLPKIHQKDHPGRSVVSFIDSHTSNISEFVDYQLQPSVQSLTSYVKDTNDLLNNIKKVSTSI